MDEEYNRLKQDQLERVLSEFERRKRKPNKNRLGDFLWLIVGLAGVSGCNYFASHIEDNTPYYIRCQNR